MSAAISVRPMTADDDLDLLNEGNSLAWQAMWWRDLSESWCMSWFTGLVDGEPAGFAAVCPMPVSADGFGAAMVNVRPGHRRRGLGAALRRTLEPVARAERPGVMYFHVEGDDDAESAVRAWGLPVVGRHQESVLDLIAISRADYEARAAAAGVEIAPVRLGDLDEAGWRDLHEFVCARYVETPDAAGGGGALPYEGFREMLTEDWMLVSAFEGGRRVGIAQVVPRGSDRHTVNTFLTGVVPSARGRGIATALKARHALVLADRGLTRLYTQNMEGNDAILAATRTLGFVPDLTTVDVACALA